MQYIVLNLYIQPKRDKFLLFIYYYLLVLANQNECDKLLQQILDYVLLCSHYRSGLWLPCENQACWSTIFLYYPKLYCFVYMPPRLYCPVQCHQEHLQQPGVLEPTSCLWRLVKTYCVFNQQSKMISWFGVLEWKAHNQCQMNRKQIWDGQAFLTLILHTNSYYILFNTFHNFYVSHKLQKCNMIFITMFSEVHKECTVFMRHFSINTISYY